MRRSLLRSLRLLAVAVTASATALAAAPAQARAHAPAPAYTAVDLGTPDESSSWAIDVSGRHVIGMSVTADGSGRHAFAYDLAKHTRTEIGSTEGGDSYIYEVSGHIAVGTSFSHDFHTSRAFAYDLRTNTRIDVAPGAVNSSAIAISGHTVVGDASFPGVSGWHPFAYDLLTHRFTDLGTLPGTTMTTAADISGRYVVATSDFGAAVRPHGFAYDLVTGQMSDIGAVSRVVAVQGPTVVALVDGDTETYDLVTRQWTVLGTLGGPDSTPRGISGHLVYGNSTYTQSMHYHAFAYDLRAHVMVDLGTFGGIVSDSADAYGDTVVGDAFDATQTDRPFAYDMNTRTMTDIGTLGGPAGAATAIDRAGTVVGRSQDGAGAMHATAWIPAY
jgi:uncharacterized membrane protein